MGSPAIAALIAHVAFWLLLASGSFLGALKGRGLAAFLTLWVWGFLGFPYLPFGAALFSSYVALLDVALVLVVAKGDVRIT
jgi:hypothetical protein